MSADRLNQRSLFPVLPAESSLPRSPAVTPGPCCDPSMHRLALPSGAASRSERPLYSRLAGLPWLGLIWVYKVFISAPLHWAAGPGSGCRFHPSCSAYAAEAIRVHGPARGLWLGLRRFVKCTPLNPGGVDFVPPRGALRPNCERISRSGITSLQ